MTAQVSAGDVGVLSTRPVRGPGLDHLQQVPTAEAVQRAGALAAVVGRKAVEVIGRARGEGLVVGTFVAREGGFVRVCRVLMQVYEGGSDSGDHRYRLGKNVWRCHGDANAT